MNLGAEPKKVAILAVILVAGVGYHFISSDDSPASASAPRVAVNIPADNTASTARVSTTAKKAQVRSAPSEFHLRVIGSRPDDKTDPASIDPELRLDLLQKVQAVEPAAAGRNLFQFGAAPAPDKPMPAIPKDVPKIAVNQPPPPRPPVTAPAPGPPPAAPINLKYYGYEVSKVDGHKQAFLLDGEDIIVAAENETVKHRYKIIRIALTSIDIEDTQAKSTQTLKLQDIPG